MPSVLITGANRGLGLEFARQYAADGWRVIATCRDPSRAHALQGLKGHVERVALDVTDNMSIGTLVGTLGQAPIDVLLLNAAVHLQKDCSLEELNEERWLLEFNVNVIAPLILARRLAGNVARSDLRRIVAISSGSGSINNMKTGGNYAYRTCKAALNASMKILAADLASRGITVVPIGPGHTRTDMGGANAPYTAEDSVARVRGAINRLTFKDSGTFLSRDGTPLPW
ncbi:MAG: SDR family oxidoreductase [Betaproteobacteria bacterium]|nr:SDR family oxidoreductase [Betaproteobacteria bacterium]